MSKETRRMVAEMNQMARRVRDLERYAADDGRGCRCATCVTTARMIALPYKYVCKQCRGAAADEKAMRDAAEVRAYEMIRESKAMASEPRSRPCCGYEAGPQLGPVSTTGYPIRPGTVPTCRPT